MSNQQDIQLAIQHFQSGNIKKSKQILACYINIHPDSIDANLLSAAISASESDFSAVVEKCKKVLMQDPVNIRAAYNAAVASEKLQNYQDVLNFTAPILQKDASNAAIILLHVSALFSQGKYTDCIQFIQPLPETVISQAPLILLKLAESYMNLAECETAIALFRQCISFKINPAECFHNIGILEDKRGNFNASISAYTSSLDITPDSLSTNYNLAFVFNKKGDKKQAIETINKCLKYHDTPKVKQGYIQILSTAGIDYIDLVTQKNILAIVCDSNIDAQLLSVLFFEIVKRDEPVIDKIYKQLRNNTDFYTLLDPDIKKIIQCSALQKYLINLSVSDYTVEQFLVILRRSLLLSYEKDLVTDNKRADLCAAIAVCCYINGYIYTVTDAEQKVIDALINKLNNRKNVSRQDTCYLSMYISLYELYNNGEITIDRGSYTENYKTLIKLQLEDAITENMLYKNIQSSTEINNDISLTVQLQYESNPYPVWQRLTIQQPESISKIISKVTSNLDKINLAFTLPVILIAGCGTGSHAIQSAMRINQKSMLAIDLSRRSLAFAKRKAIEYGLEHIDFRQVDILQIANIGKTFDVIESVGVLHHMQNPLTGLQSLVDVLKPGGLMNLGFYSKQGRRYIIKAKSIYDTPDCHLSDDEIRQIRLQVMQSNDDNLIKNITAFKDFYSLHDCRDMIFHENENNYNLDEIAVMLDSANLDFIGFDMLDDSVFDSFTKMFPEKDARSKLSNWQLFEEKYPDTFASMYVFWCQKIQ